VEGEESDDLKYMFGSEIRYLDYYESAESRLTAPYEYQYPLKMYRIYSNGKIHLVSLKKRNNQIKMKIIMIKNKNKNKIYIYIYIY